MLACIIFYGILFCRYRNLPEEWEPPTKEEYKEMVCPYVYVVINFGVRVESNYWLYVWLSDCVCLVVWSVGSASFIRESCCLMRKSDFCVYRHVSVWCFEFGKTISLPVSVDRAI